MENKFKKLGMISILFFAIFVLAYFSFAKNGEKGAVTQGELAKVLTEQMDLDVEKGASTKECFIALEKAGIKPTGAWEENKPVSREDLGNVLVDAGRLQAEVLGGKDTQAVLKERGIILPKEVNKRTLDDVLKDKNVNRLFETPAVSGPSVPFPKTEVKLIETRPEFIIPSLEAQIPTPTQPPPTEEETTQPTTQLPPLTEPPTTEFRPPSGGGAQ